MRATWRMTRGAKPRWFLGGKEKKGEKSDLAKWKAVRPSNFLGAQDVAAQGNADLAVFHAVPKGDEPRSGGGFDSFQSFQSFIRSGMIHHGYPNFTLHSETRSSESVLFREWCMKCEILYLDSYFKACMLMDIGYELECIDLR